MKAKIRVGKELGKGIKRQRGMGHQDRIGRYNTTVGINSLGTGEITIITRRLELGNSQQYTGGLCR